MGELKDTLINTFDLNTVELSRLRIVQVLISIVTTLFLPPPPTVADNHQFLHEAYVSDKLVKDIHKLLKLHPKGISLDKFKTSFEVSLSAMKQTSLA